MFDLNKYTIGPFKHIHSQKKIFNELRQPFGDWRPHQSPSASLLKTPAVRNHNRNQCSLFFQWLKIKFYFHTLCTHFGVSPILLPKRVFNVLFLSERNLCGSGIGPVLRIVLCSTMLYCDGH